MSHEVINSFNRTTKLIGLLSLFVIILNCFSYPVTSVIIAYLKVPSNSINIGLKFIYLCFALLSIFIVSVKDGVRVPKLMLGGMIFLLLYSVRLIFDLGILNIPITAYSSSYVFSYFFGATLAPIIALIVGYKYLDVKLLTKYIFWTLVIANIFLIYYLLVLGDFGDLEKQLAMRAHIKTEGGTGTLINPILIGYYGASLFLFCLNAILIDLFSSKFLKLLLYPLLGLGCIVLLLGASRGPLVGLIFMISLSLIFHFFRSREKVVKLGKGLLIGFAGIYLLSGTITQLTKKYDIHLIYRMEKFFNDREKGRKEVRDLSFEGAWNDFLSSPVVGKQFVGTYDNFYPHNIFLEVLMATGILGGIFFLWYFSNFLKSSIILLSIEKYKFHTPVAFTCLLCFFLSITSGSIFGSPDIWILMTLNTLLIKV